jgi:hypothetical protein
MRATIPRGISNRSVFANAVQQGHWHISKTLAWRLVRLGAIAATFFVGGLATGLRAQQPANASSIALTLQEASVSRGAGQAPGSEAVQPQSSALCAGVNPRLQRRQRTAGTELLPRAWELLCRRPLKFVPSSAGPASEPDLSERPDHHRERRGGERPARVSFAEGDSECTCVCEWQAVTARTAVDDQQSVDSGRGFDYTSRKLGMR